MRKHVFYVLSVLCTFLWLGIVLMLSRDHQAQDQGLPEDNNRLMLERMEGLESKISQQIEENNRLLELLKKSLKDGVVPDQMKPTRDEEKSDNHPAADDDQVGGVEQHQVESVEAEVEKKPVIPILLFACNRVSVNKALDLLLAYRPDQDLYPIIVTQDCGHKETAKVIESYGDQIISIKQPDLSDPVVPPKEKKFKGYFKIARHYGWALNQTFNVYGYDQVVIVEDDLEVAPDFFEYFTATLPILKADKSLWCVSAWNDNGKTGLIDENAVELLYRTDFFPGLGWMITKDLWKEIGPKWPRSYWDDWMREPAQRQERACIRPEVSRTKTFGKVGVSNGLFYEKHLKFILLNNKFVPFTAMDLSTLIKDNYDKNFVAEVYKTKVYSLEDIKKGLNLPSRESVRIIYRNRDSFKKISKSLGIMDDFKSGVPRMAYRGIVSFMYRGRRIFLAPNTNWQGYDPKWS